MRKTKLTILFIVLVFVGFMVLTYKSRAEYQTKDVDFTFVQMSDVHWGFNDSKINPDFDGTFRKAINAVNKLDPAPDFVVFTGDLTHTTKDPVERNRRMKEFRAIVKGLNVKKVIFLAGEHDAGLDNGKIYKQDFGRSYYSFDHNGIHFIALDNASDADSNLGEVQLQWLGNDLKKHNKDEALIVLTHRPLFELYQQWDWWTRDGAQALELLSPFRIVSVFYGHIHQLDRRVTGNIIHYAAQGLMYPLPAAGSVAKKAPVAWDPAHPYKGLGFRSVLVKVNNGECVATDYTLEGTVCSVNCAVYTSP